MQRVRFINPQGNAVTIGIGKPYVFEKIIGIGAEDAQLVTSEPAFMNGRPFHGLYFGDREITVNLNIYGESRTALYANRQHLISVLSSGQSASGRMGTLEYKNDHITVWIPAIVKRGPQSTDRIGNYNRSVQIVFFCPDPFWRSMEQTISRIAYMGGGMTFPIEFGAVEFGAQGYEATLFNAGDSPAPLVISITGPSLQPEIVKASTGEYIRVKRELYEGDVLLIDTEPGNRSVTIQRAGGSVESAFGYIDLTSTFFSLDPGNNLLRYVSGDDSKTSTILLMAHSRYGGV